MKLKLISLVVIPLVTVGCAGCALRRPSFNVDPKDGRIWFQAKENGHKEIWVLYGDRFVRESVLHK